MEIKDETYERFNYVMDNILLPVVENNEENIKKILNEDLELKQKVEDEVDRILKARAEKLKGG